jgi:branched-chain amino acid aminotransferase
MLVTPQVGNILPGITRATIIELARSQGIEVIETRLREEDVKSADSMFFVGTAAEVVGVSLLDEYEFPVKWENSIGAKLGAAYSKLVRSSDQRIVAV